MSRKISRRQFMRYGAAAGVVIAGAGVTRGYEKNSKVRMACIGAGGRAGAGVGVGMGQHIVAVAEVDLQRAAKNIDKVKKTFPDVKVYTDYRKLFDENKKLDGVWVGTPDHNHFPASIRALEAGAAVYCEKPLTWSIGESRKLREVAEKKNLITQLGNQGHSGQAIRLMGEYFRGGSLGQIARVDCCSAKGWGGGKFRDGTKPEGLDWDSWLGPAKQRPYQAGPHPGSWRKFLEYGTGTLGDMGIHTMDGAIWGLRLTEVSQFEVEAPIGRPIGDGHPVDAIIKWTFPARGDMAPVSLVWHQGKQRPELPGPVEARAMAKKMVPHGSVFHGEKGYMVSNSHCGTARLVPESFHKETGSPKELIPRSPKGHSGDWIEAIKNSSAPKPSSHFGYSAKLTEILLAGVVAWRTGEKLTYDMNAGTFNNAKANALIWRTPRKGWEFGYPV